LFLEGEYESLEADFNFTHDPIFSGEKGIAAERRKP
jgi:hypothetical protein